MCLDPFLLSAHYCYQPWHVDPCMSYEVLIICRSAYEFYVRSIGVGGLNNIAAAKMVATLNERYPWAGSCRVAPTLHFVELFI